MSREGVRRVSLIGLRVLIAALIAGALYLLVIPNMSVDPSRLAALVLDRPGNLDLSPRPTVSTPLPRGSSPIPAVIQAGRSDPNETGLYQVQWGSAPALSALILVSRVPSVAIAKVALKQTQTQYLSADSFSPTSFNRRALYTFQGVPGIKAGLYARQASGRVPEAALRSGVFRVGEVVATVIVQGKNASAPTFQSLATAEYLHLIHLPIGLPIAERNWPILASAIYGSVAIIGMGLFLSSPLAFARVRQRRTERSERIRSRMRARKRADLKRREKRKAQRRSRSR